MMTAPTTLARIDQLFHALHRHPASACLRPLWPDRDCGVPRLSGSKFPELPQTICDCCGRLLEHGERSGASQLCHACAAERPAVAQARAPFLYDEPVCRHYPSSEVRWSLCPGACAWRSHGGALATLGGTGGRAGRPCRCMHAGSDSAALTRRSCWRGASARSTGLPVTTHSIRRERHTQPQVRLNPEQRAANVAGAFSAVGDELRDRHVLLIDDVYTTGATMNATADCGVGRRRAPCLSILCGTS